ncbi:hypothetical protein [uncultured Winogradskyella sp.]|uniref:hypothetical protein n=1 Tax=uncultured Winogradskyella sp. TaxID=395353 RepID=UPI0030EE6E6B|tara:strand:- start:216 stop:494 length:279 start_codon:yes stop_codon:yes gene_type:complete
MKKLIFKILSIIIGLIIILTIYINSDTFIEKQEWKHAEGTHIGDWLGKNTFKINDGIIQTNSGKAKIVFSFGIELIIENIDTKEKGFYINKS